MNKRVAFFVFCTSVFLSNTIYPQESKKLSLEQSINYALKNSFSIPVPYRCQSVDYIPVCLRIIRLISTAKAEWEQWQRIAYGRIGGGGNHSVGGGCFVSGWYNQHGGYELAQHADFRI